MVIFTAIATFLASTSFLAGTFFATTLGIQIMAAGIGLATITGVSYVMKALAGNQPAQQNHFSTQGTISAGGDVPRSFGLGWHLTAGSLVYANYWGNDGDTPNAYLTMVIAVGDIPREQLLDVWVSGEKVTLLTGSADPDMGFPVLEYRAGSPHDNLWIKYYDGTQTAADPFLVNRVSSSDRPYLSTRVGTGVCYVIATALVNDNLFTGFPTYKFVLSGIPLYDPTQDDTNGGSGPHRYSDPSTWGGDGDQLPAVQAYNVLRGIRYNGAWLYGLQNMTGQARLPAANWNAQIAKCRAVIPDALDGPEPTYRCGGQVDVNTQPANAVEAILTSCAGRLAEIGGFYKIYVGAPDSATFTWTDADLLSSAQQTYRPFFSLADSVNGIQGTYPDPAQGWQTATAPPLYRTDLEITDGNRRLMAAPSFDFVPYPEQVQRLQKSGIEEAQRARTHVLPFPAEYWPVEPGDVGSWTSLRNGYVNKLFRVDSVVDQANLDVIMSVTEVDPSDYDWTHSTDYTGVTTGPTMIPRPKPQGVVDWYAEGTVLYDSNGIAGHPAIRIVWDGTQPGVVGVQYEVRLTADLSSVTRGRTDQLAVGALIISQGILPLTAYQVRGQYLPSSPRDMLWSDWLDVTTPDVPAADIPAWISDQVTNVMDFLNDRLLEVEQRLSTITATNGQRNWLDQKEVRSQLSSTTGAAMAAISDVQTAYTAADTALASDIATVSAQVGTNTANITTNATAIATLDGYAAAEYAVTLDVNNYAVGFNLINGGPGISAATFTFDKFQIAAPGQAGGAPVPIFTVANVGGAPKVAIRGDMYVDGSIAGNKIIAGDITATQIKANSISADRLLAGTITSASGKIGALSVQSLSIGDNAATVPAVQNINSNVTNSLAPMASFNLSIDTTGLSGKSIPIWALATLIASGMSTAATFDGNLYINGALAQSVGGQGSPPTLTLSGKIDVAANGAVMNVPVLLQCVSSGTFACTGSLFAIAAKR